MPTIALIVAHDEDRLIGIGDLLPWQDRERYADLADATRADLKNFKKLTTGHVVIMGRRTWMTLDRPLPNRINIVLTREASFTAKGAEVAHTLDDALAKVPEGRTAFIGGGGEIYRLALDRADVIYRTVIHRRFGEPGGANVYFPELDESEWQRTDVRHLGPATIETLERRGQ